MKKIYRKNDLTGEGVRLFYKGSSRSLSGSNEQTRFHAQITDKANTQIERAGFPCYKLKKEPVPKKKQILRDRSIF